MHTPYLTTALQAAPYNTIPCTNLHHSVGRTSHGSHSHTPPQENPNISGNLLKIEKERGELTEALERATRELRTHGTFTTVLGTVSRLGWGGVGGHYNKGVCRGWHGR